MARVARDCVKKTYQLMKELELKLGPDTSDLSIRIGLHSGPVTGKSTFSHRLLPCPAPVSYIFLVLWHFIAGVLRGQRARFQLFGDTMNVAARMGEI